MTNFDLITNKWEKLVVSINSNVIRLSFHRFYNDAKEKLIRCRIDFCSFFSFLFIVFSCMSFSFFLSLSLSRSILCKTRRKKTQMHHVTTFRIRVSTKHLSMISIFSLENAIIISFIVSHVVVFLFCLPSFNAKLLRFASIYI